MFFIKNEKEKKDLKNRIKDAKHWAVKEMDHIDHGNINTEKYMHLHKVARNIAIVFVIAGVMGVISLFIGWGIVLGESMNDTFQNGDIYWYKTSLLSEVNRGDVVVASLENNAGYVIKRVVAVGGDTVEAYDDQLFVNGEAVEESYVLGKTADFNKIIVPPGSCFLMGDNRENSCDSRDFGPIEKEDIQGVLQNIIF